MNRGLGELHRVESEMDAVAGHDFADEGTAQLEAYLAKHLAFTRFIIERAWQAGDTESLRELGELETVELQVAV